MGLVTAKVRLSNPRFPELEPIEIEALVDTGAVLTCIPEHVVVQLSLTTTDRREVTVADGRHMTVPYAGPIQFRFANRSCFGGALVMGDRVLLGATAMEDMDLVVDPSWGKLSVNPQNPNMPAVLAVGALPAR